MFSSSLPRYRNPLENRDMDEKPPLQPINSKLAAIYSLSSTSTSRPYIIKKDRQSVNVRSRAFPSWNKNTSEDADMLAVSRKLQVQGYMSGNLYFSKKQLVVLWRRLRCARPKNESTKTLCRRLSESQREVRQTTWVFCCRKSKVCLLEHSVQSPTGKTVCVWGFARPSTKLDMMLTWFWDYAAEPRSYGIWVRGYKNLSRLRSSLLHYNHSIRLSSKPKNTTGMFAAFSFKSYI